MCSGGDGGTLPGECFWYERSLVGEVGIRIHLIGVLPAGILVCFQFIPAIRRKWILFHRVNGYVILLMVLAGIAGAFMIARHAVGGGLDVQTGTGFLGLIVFIELGLAWWNIKKLQIDQHRAWMLRAWFLASRSLISSSALVNLVTAAGYPHHDAYNPLHRCTDHQQTRKLLSASPLRTRRVHARVCDGHARVLPGVCFLL